MKLKVFALGIAIILGLALAGYGSFHFAIYKHNREKLSDLGANQSTFETFIKRVHKETPYTVYITSGYRSIKHQQRLYKQNKKNAKPGSSPHEYKRAIDINLLSMKAPHPKRRQQRNLEEDWCTTNRSRNGTALGWKLQILS